MTKPQNELPLGSNFSINAFPRTNTDPFIITSSVNPIYNCIAWAYGENSVFIWPEQGAYWPDDIPRTLSFDSFIKLFKKKNFVVCSNGMLETDFEKIVIYEKEGKPSHAAKQLVDGNWSSKLGQSYDVTHTLQSMSNGFYGSPKIFMKRRIKNL